MLKRIHETASAVLPTIQQNPNKERKISIENSPTDL